eukprot:GHVO01006702.1.p1 GENE.GHVO01006702.1~~GHVO01006702.1.p1  ORF type:complete len:103 (-),score=0.90 GHVO01006702.1:429-737(-)
MAKKAKKAVAVTPTKKAINFADGVFITEHKFANGTSVFKQNFNARQFCNWMKENVNEKGYVQTDVFLNKEGSKFTHSMRHNDYNPQQAAKAEIVQTLEEMPF